MVLILKLMMIEVSYLVCWYSEPSQPEMIISGTMEAKNEFLLKSAKTEQDSNGRLN